MGILKPLSSARTVPLDFLLLSIIPLHAVKTVSLQVSGDLEGEYDDDCNDDVVDEKHPDDLGVRGVILIYPYRV